MAKYRVTIEAPGVHEEVIFEADSPEEAEEIGKQEFFEVCNYGVAEVKEAL